MKTIAVKHELKPELESEVDNYTYIRDNINIHCLWLYSVDCWQRDWFAGLAQSTRGERKPSKGLACP